VSDERERRLVQLRMAFESGLLDEDTYPAAIAGLGFVVAGSGSVAQGNGAVAAGAYGLPAVRTAQFSKLEVPGQKSLCLYPCYRRWPSCQDLWKKRRFPS
jgi:hypothetical protein